MDRKTKLEGLECLLILQYLIRDISVNQKKKICKLKELKLYTSLNYETISLTAQKILVFDNNTSMPRDGLAELFSFLEVDVIVDIYERKAFNLFQLLGCDRVNSVQMYLQYILPNLKYIDEQNRILHLEFVKDFLLSDRNVAFALKSHKLFSIGQFFCKGSDLYDPENELFATACFQHEFPPSPFCDSSWRKFHAGMRTKLSEEVLLCFAKRAAHQDINHHQLVVAFVDFVDKTNVENSFLNAMASILFVPLDCHEFEYEKIHQSFEPNMKFITYAGSNSHENIKLLWTSANVLPKYAMPREKLIRSKLKIVLEPDFNLVVNHLRCICYELVKTCTLHDENILTEVMTSIYDFFNKAGGNVSCIKDVPLVHVLAHKMFARVNQVVVYLSEEDEIAPFLVKAPTEYGRFFKLFHALGMNSEPTSNNYATVLKDLQEYVAKRVLSPNELNLVRKALKGFMKSLQNLDEPINKLDVDVLYLLSDDNHLKPSTELYYDSLEIPRNRLEGMSNLCFIADMSCIGFNVSELHLLFSYLPHANRPLSVSLFVKEHIQFKELHESSVASSLHDCLTSDIFILAVLRIIKHDQLSLKNDFNAKEMEIVSGRLRRLRVLAVSGLKTLFADQKSMSHAKSKPCALDESNEILYLEDFHMGLDSWLQSYDVELESILRVLCHNKFQPGSILAFLTHINSPSINIHDRLTKVGKGFLEDEELSCIWHPCPGSFVPEELIPLLQKVSKQIPIKEYAVIDNQIDDAYIYVIVTGYNSFSKKYSLNIGQNEDIEISEDNLFEIKSLFSDDENTTEEQIRNDTYTFLPTDSIDGHSTLEYARTYHLSGKPNKQIGFGRKWLNQAIYDLQTGFATLKGVNKEKVKGHNWVCLQSQQAAEKAIKGARYATDANKFQLSHHLQSNIPDGDFTLEQFASSLQSIIRDVNKLRYPDIYNIPADMYSNDHAVKALDLSHKIVEYVKSKYFGHCTDLDDW